MDTSGILIVAITKASQRALSIQFQDRIVKKEYEALLDGILSEDEGNIEFKARLDVENRPYQIFDDEQGKLGITAWKKLAIEGDKTRVRFYPHTGRTHQLRIHSAFKQGLNCPIIGDRLYGTVKDGERLMLHAAKIEFNHPVTGEKIILETKAPF